MFKIVAYNSDVCIAFWVAVSIFAWFSTLLRGSLFILIQREMSISITGWPILRSDLRKCRRLNPIDYSVLFLQKNVLQLFIKLFLDRILKTIKKTITLKVLQIAKKIEPRFRFKRLYKTCIINAEETDKK